jgi:acyl-CoA thioesterase
MTNTSEAERALSILAALPDEVRAFALAGLEYWADRDAYTGPFGWLVGLHYTERLPGRVSCMIDVQPLHYNPGRIAHGGVIFTLADSAMGAAVFSLLEPGERCSTAELKLNYLAPVVQGVVTATATVISKRRRLAVVTAEVRDASGELMGLAQGTFAISPGEFPRPIEGDG